MMTSLVGLALGAMIGAGCRWFSLPLPAPLRITGALLVVSVTLGFILADAGITHWEIAP